MGKTVTLREMIVEAAELLEVEEHSNPEYLRALCELTARCFERDGMPTPERTEEIEKAILEQNKIAKKT